MAIHAENWKIYQYNSNIFPARFFVTLPRSTDKTSFCTSLCFNVIFLYCASAGSHIEDKNVVKLHYERPNFNSKRTIQWNGFERTKLEKTNALKEREINAYHVFRTDVHKRSGREEREGGPRKTHTERTRMKYGKPYNRACDRVITESGDGIFFLLHCLLSGILIPKRNHK